MSTPPDSRPPGPGAGPGGGKPEERPLSDRRARAALRALVDEMLLQIRATSRSDDWTEEDRARAQADLERIMESVRLEAMRGRGEAED